jgi:hypothetical protein
VGFQARLRYFVAGLVVGVLLLSVGLGKANAYTQAKHVIYNVFPHATVVTLAIASIDGIRKRAASLARGSRLRSFGNPQTGDRSTVASPMP